MLKRLFMGMGIVCLSHTASATLVTFELDPSSHIISQKVDGQTVLEWLRWDQTRGMSIDDALNNFAPLSAGGEWKLASLKQMASLINAFDFGFIYAGKENVQQSVSDNDGATELATDPQKRFVNLFGNTYPDYVGNHGSPDPLEYTQAWFGRDDDGDGMFNKALIYDDFVFQDSINVIDGSVSLSADFVTSSYTQSNAGVALVRGNFLEVPEPPLAALLAAFSVVLIGRRTLSTG